MTFTHDDIQQRLIEFLYGELDGEARAAFDAHIGACERCRLEVQAFQQTRAVARAAVRAPLDRPVPAAVRARVMESAMRAAVEFASAHKAPARPKVSRDGGATPRWLAWLRSRWTLPMLTTVAAMGALLLFRETIFREARRPLGDATVDELFPKPAPAAPGDEQVPGGSLEPEAKPTSEPTGRTTTRPASSSPRRRASAPATSAAGARAQKVKADSFGSADGALGGSEHKGGFEDHLLSKMRADKAAGPADIKDEQPKPQKRNLDDVLEGALNRSGERPRTNEREASRAPAKSAPAQAEDEAELDQDRARFAQPPPTERKSGVAATPPPAPAPRAPAPVAPAARVAAEASSAAGPSAISGSSESASAADVPSPAPRAKKSKKDEKAAASEAAPTTPSSVAREPVAATPTGSASRQAPGAVAVLVDRAEKAMTARRWDQAVAVYRDLLQRFSQHAAVPTWRRRLAAAQAAAAEDQNRAGNSGFAIPPPPR